YKKYEPIGCRDERTYDTFSKYEIKCYLAGCLTAALPKRDNNIVGSKVFVIDAPEGLANYIPGHLLTNAVYGQHTLFTKTTDAKALAQGIYDEYKAEAKLVITSLLHCAVPCMAAGIPVVLAKTICSYRFAWLERLLPIYLPGEFASIDWDPTPVQYEVYKKLILKICSDRLQGICNNSEIVRLHDFYMNRTRKTYAIDAFYSIKEFLDTNWKDPDGAYNYSVWGLTQISEYTVSYITKYYPNATLRYVYDKNTDLSFQGIQAVDPACICSDADETILVTTVSALYEAQQLFDKLGKPSGSYAFIKSIY
ncbi:MAG: polysaccharide pyruvyl transferase family protein, partial [Anaerovoracaceae bacterium]